MAAAAVADARVSVAAAGEVAAVVVAAAGAGV